MTVIQLRAARLSQFGLLERKLADQKERAITSAKGALQGVQLF